jgi:hypothetical protein
VPCALSTTVGTSDTVGEDVGMLADAVGANVTAVGVTDKADGKDDEEEESPRDGASDPSVVPVIPITKTF